MQKLTLPNIIFKTRVAEDLSDINSAYIWKHETTEEIFSGIRAIIFSLPGAFTPICSSYQLPGFDNMYSNFNSHGIEKIYCISVNDTFVMNAWKSTLDIKNISVLPDGSGEFTRKMGMLVRKDNLGFGMRSWRYAAIVNDCSIEKLFEESGFSDNCPDDPYDISKPENILKFLENKM